MGDVGSHTFDLFVRTSGRHTFLVAGRNPDAFQARVNLSLFAALQLGYTPEVQLTSIDLQHIERTAEIIDQFRPDIIFTAATLQKWGALNNLPSPAREQLYQAQIGPWLPLQLVLPYCLMQAVKQTGQTPLVINATYPDVIHSILDKVGLAPTTGVGDLANNVPALRVAAASKLGVPVTEVEVRLVASHHAHYYLSRKGTPDGAPIYVIVQVQGENVTSRLVQDDLFHSLHHTFKRAPGNQMTAASAAAVFAGMMNGTGSLTHAPGPCGLPGCYPVSVTPAGVTVSLPDGVSLETAIAINTAGQRLDGIERIDDDGTVWFGERHMVILKHLLGYECQSMALADVREQANELLRKYTVFTQTTS